MVVYDTIILVLPANKSGDSKIRPQQRRGILLSSTLSSQDTSQAFPS
jgi:hypothetical protein